MKFTNPTINLPNNTNNNVFPKSVGLNNLVKTGRLKILIPNEAKEANKYMVAFFLALYSFVKKEFIVFSNLFSIF